MASEEWTEAGHANRYLALADSVPRRAEGERVLSDQVPLDARRILDLGTGDGRLLALLRADRPASRGVALDFSELMLDAAGTRFAGDERVDLVQHNLVDPLPRLGSFDVVVSSMAIHHLEHERKRALYGEIFELLEPGGVFANFEHVASATDRLHLKFFAAICEPLEHEDPSDRLLDVETQLGWLREHGFDDVDCYWKWLEMALLVGVKPDDRPTLFEYAGGESAFLALAAAHHQRCIEDPELNHPFSHPGQHPQHVERLAAYWAEVMGGPSSYSRACGDQSGMLQMHAGNGDMGDLGERFVRCFDLALDDAQLPADPGFRAAMHAYMRWAVDDVLTYSPRDTVVAPGAAMPRWGWDGLQP